jgi:hypothetical protein
MIKIISHRNVVEEHKYYIFYEWVEKPLAGFMFSCNQYGEIDFNNMSPEALSNYEKCESDEYEVIYRGLQREVNRIIEPAIGECHCGTQVVLGSNTNECPKCRTLYNSAGMELTRPDNWGEETGEHPADVRRWMI